MYLMNLNSLNPKLFDCYKYHSCPSILSAYKFLYVYFYMLFLLLWQCASAKNNVLYSKPNFGAF